jgi:DNA-binding NarL/FixJ family response regulator
VISVVIVADSGAALRRLSELVNALPDVDILRHLSGGAPVGATVAAAAPDVVVLDELRWPGMTVRRIAEMSELSRARVIVCASQLEAGWLADALRSGASAVIPRSADAATLRIVLGEVLAAGAFGTPADETVQAA